MGKNIHGGDIYRHKNVIDYSSNCNPFGVPEGVVQAICQAAREVNHYPDVQASELREAVSEALSIDHERIFFGNGAAEVILDIVFALKPKKALLPAPTFVEYGEALGAADCCCSYYLLREEKDFCCQEDILDYITDDFDIMFLCNPNNPTGVLTEKSLVSRIAEKCKEAGVVLVIDECFLDFVEEGKNCTMLDELERFHNVIILRAFTKLYAMAGVRLGYCLCADLEMMGRLDAVRQPWNVSGLAQAAGVAALKETEYVRESLEAIAVERCWLIDQLETLGLKTYGSKANYIFFKGNKNLYDRCLERGIMIRDCSNYVGLEKGYYRIAVRLHEDNEKLIKVLSEEI